MSKPWIALLALMLLFKNNLIDAANLRVRHKLPTKAPFWYKNFPPWWINPGALKAEASNYVNDAAILFLGGNRKISGITIPLYYRCNTAAP